VLSDAEAIKAQVPSVTKVAPVDEQKMSISFNNKLISTTNAKNLVLKLGGDGFISYKNNHSKNLVERQYFPALIVNPVDTTGAGDSLVSVLSAGIGCKIDFMVASALAAIVAGITVSRMGNIPIQAAEVKNYINNLKWQEK
jgi:sugar/nucleoside kinase (ribokinase family)